MATDNQQPDEVEHFSSNVFPGAKSLRNRFPTLSSAISFTTVLLLGLTILYGITHWDRLRRPMPVAAKHPTVCRAAEDQNNNQEGAPTSSTLCNCSDITDYIPWGCSVRLMPVGYLLFDTDDETLLRYFPPARVAEFKTSLDQRIRTLRETALTERQAAIHNAADLAARSIRAELPYPLYLYQQDMSGRIAGQLPANAYETTNLKALAQWLEARGELQRSDRAKKYEELVTNLTDVIGREEGAALEILSKPLNLDDALSFRWLYIEKGGWLIELTFLALFGVLVQTLAVLIGMKRTPESPSTAPPTYDSAQFVLLFPRLVMAPIVAIVVLAMVVAGVTGIELTLSNLPVFLFFAFILGFANDRLIEVIRGAVRYFIPRLAINEEKITERYGAEARKRAFKTLATFQPHKEPPQNLEELRAIAQDRVAAEISKEFSGAQETKETRGNAP